jgi:hypothetical protein
MPLEGRGPHMIARSEETPAVHGNGAPVATKLLRIAEKARKEASFKFTSLYHLMNEELLRECFKRLRKDAAAGIDEMTKEQYAANLDANLSDLTGRLHRMAYRPQPVRRVYIPKPGSAKQRWGYHALKTNLSRREWSGYWKRYLSRTS